MYNIKKRITSLAIAILILVMALPINATSDGKVVSKNKTEDFYIELFEEDGVYTYYYEDYESKSNIVITSSQEAGTNVYYNYKGQVFKVKLDDIGIRYISNINSFNSLKNNIVSTSKNINMEYIDLSLLVVPIKNETISPEGYTNTMRYFRGFAGGEYTDELISSATIRGYNCQVFEDKTLDLREINRHVALAGDALGLVLSILSMPKSVSIVLGIVTFYKNGKEFLKYSYTILKYRGTESFRRDATVNGGTYHQVQKKVCLYYMGE